VSQLGQPLSSWGRAASMYAERLGWSVHLLKPGAKEPATAHGFRDATTDPEQIRQWWIERPAGNVGIATGRASGISVLDVDVKDGAGGADTLASLLAEHGGSLDGHACQRTWSGGLQYFFAYEPRACQGVNCYGPGLDGRNDGGYCVVSPSLVNGQAYRWIVQPSRQLRPMPEWLLEARGTTGTSNGLKTPQGHAAVLAPDRTALVAIRTWLAAAKPGTWTKVRCPAHDDRSPSLQVWKLADGSARFRCWGPGCSADVIGAIPVLGSRLLGRRDRRDGRRVAKCGSVAPGPALGEGAWSGRGVWSERCFVPKSRAGRAPGGWPMSPRMIAPEQRGPGGSRKRPPLDLPALVLPAGVPLAEYAVTVAEAARLLIVSFQTVHQQIERRTLPAYLHEGRKFVRLDDLVETRTARAQAAQSAELAWLEAMSRELHESPWPKELGGPFPCPAWCTVCERARMSRRGRRPNPTVLANLARGRARAQERNRERRAQQAAELAAYRAAEQMEPAR
jgi:hypothetical protein